MIIYSFIHTKGGVGKTTLVQCIPHTKTFQKTYKKIALIELDEQESLVKWYNRRKEIGKNNFNIKFGIATGNDKNEVQHKIIEAIEDCDAAILDVPGESTSRFATKLAIDLSDVLLMPMRASTKDEDAFGSKLFPDIKFYVREQKNKKVFYIVPTFFHLLTNSKNIKLYFDDIMPEGIKCLSTFLPHRSVYENFDRDGMNLFEYAEQVKNNVRQFNQAQKAIEDFEKIAKEILKIY